MTDWVERYTEIADKFNEFGKSLKGTSFKKVEQATELFALMCIKLCREDATAIALLIEKGLYCEAMMILRSSLELLFKLHWISKGKDHDEKNERTFCLEGKPFFDSEHEIIYLNDQLIKNESIHDRSFVDKLKLAMTKHKENYPHLIRDNGKFKTSPKNPKMAGNDLRQRFYHVFRYLCIFTHPTPLLRDLLLTKDSGEEAFRESVEKALNYGIMANTIILKFSSKILSEHFPDAYETWEKLYNEMKEMAKKTE